MVFQVTLRALLWFWPGGLSVWRKGDFHALALAILFGIFLNIACLGSFVWTEWISPLWLVSIWTGLGLAVVGAGVQSTLWTTGRKSGLSIEERTRTLCQSQEFYLQGNYFEAEQLLRKNLLSSEDDSESLLLLVSVLRRTGRAEDALEWIDHAMRREVAARWQTEFLHEKQQCIRAQIGSPPAHE